MRIFFQCRTASSGGGDDDVEICYGERFEICASKISCHVSNACVRRKRSTATLHPGHHHLAAIRLKHSNRCAIQLTESHLGNTACKKSDSRLPGPAGSERLS